jgi:hypothetical protein
MLVHLQFEFNEIGINWIYNICALNNQYLHIKRQLVNSLCISELKQTETYPATQLQSLCWNLHLSRAQG